MKLRRVLVFLIETTCNDGESLRPYTVKTLREYADVLESDVVGLEDLEKWIDSKGSEIKVVHGASEFLK